MDLSRLKVSGGWLLSQVLESGGKRGGSILPQCNSPHGVQRTGTVGLGVAPRSRDGRGVCILFPRGCYIYVYCFGQGAPLCLCVCLCVSTFCVRHCLWLASWPKSSNENNMLTKGWPQRPKMTTGTLFLCLLFSCQWYDDSHRRSLNRVINNSWQVAQQWRGRCMQKFACECVFLGFDCMAMFPFDPSVLLPV